MDQILNSFFSLPVVLFCIGIYIAVFAFRKTVEFLGKEIAHIVPDKYEPWWQYGWREVILPIAPLVLGGLFAYFIVDFPYPEEIKSSDYARAIFGTVCGLLSAWIYPRALFYWKQYSASKVDESAKDLGLPPSE